MIDKREADIAVNEAKNSERSKELDRRESEIVQSENRVNEALAASESKNSEAERKMRAADCMYDKQLELNQRYEKLQRELRDVQMERSQKIAEIRHIRQALGISLSDENTDPVEKINSIRDENHAIDQLLSDELHLPWSQMKTTTPIEMLHMLIDRFKTRISEADKEISESKSIIDKLTEQLYFIKRSFVKAVLALNALVYSNQYNRGLTGISKALATGISLFKDNIFRNLGEFDSIDKSAIDSEIKENMSHFIEPERTRTNRIER